MVFNPQGDVLISRRAEYLHQGGKWEFPGGKVEPGETAFQALQRELLEELGVGLQRADPLVQIPYAYDDKKVFLDVWVSKGYSGAVESREGQPWRWLPLSQLEDYEFPAANQGIIDSLLLPREYVITPEPEDQQSFLEQLSQVLRSGIKMLQLRCKTLSRKQYLDLAVQVAEQCRDQGVLLFLNGDPDLLSQVSADGLHLSSFWLQQLRSRPDVRWVSAACHNAEELNKAQTLGVNCVLASPVQATQSHPWAHPLGWDGFENLVNQARVPVYALGGIKPSDLQQIRQRGGQGVAGIRGFWGPTNPNPNP